MKTKEIREVVKEYSVFIEHALDWPFLLLLDSLAVSLPLFAMAKDISTLL